MILERNKIPTPGEGISFHLPEIKELQLLNEIKVLFIEKRSLPMINITILFECGSKFDPPGKEGLSYMFAALADEGSGKYSAFELHDEFDFLGANFSLSCDEDYIYFSIQTLTEHIDKALELFSTVILKPHLTEEAFKREKKRVSTRILQRKDYPDNAADSLFIYKLMGKTSPYSHPAIGLINSIENITLDDIKIFYEQSINVNTASITAAGNISPDELQSKLNFFFADLKYSSALNTPKYFENEIKKKLYIVNFKDAAQTEIRIGCKSPCRNDYNIFSRQLLNTILGGQYSSRINQNLRERKGFTYGASSVFNYWKNGAFFCVTTSVNTSNTWDALREILFELKEIKKGVEYSEMEFAKSTLIKKFPLFFETYNQLNGNLITLVKHSLQRDYFDKYSMNIQKTNIDEINLASELIDMDKIILVLAGDCEKIKTQIADPDEFEIVEINSGEDLFH